MEPLPKKRYNIIYADPPWEYENSGVHGAAENHYSVMTDEEIAALPVQEIAADDCVLFCWATFPKLIEALTVVKAWGFEYRTTAFVWVKTYPNGNYIKSTGFWTRSNAEIVLFAKKGKPKRQSDSVSQVIIQGRREHSQKPDVVRQRIVQLMGDLPRIELFARIKPHGWDCWGNDPNLRDQQPLDIWSRFQ